MVLSKDAWWSWPYYSCQRLLDLMTSMPSTHPDWSEYRYACISRRLPVHRRMPQHAPSRSLRRLPGATTILIRAERFTFRDSIVLGNPRTTRTLSWALTARTQCRKRSVRCSGEHPSLQTMCGADCRVCITSCKSSRPSQDVDPFHHDIASSYQSGEVHQPCHGVIVTD